MNYNPRRDIPKAVRELKTLSPSRIRDWVRDNRTEKDKITGKKRQKEITAKAITMWFTRNAEVKEQLTKELEDEELPRQAISESLFENGTFLKLPCIKKWITKMRGKRASEDSIMNYIRALKQICLGRLPQSRAEQRAKKPPIFLDEWGLKHPRRLTLQDCLDYNSEVVKRELKGRGHRLAMRSFLQSRNVEGWTEISGALEITAGQYAHLYATPDQMKSIFAWLKRVNKEAHDSVYFAFKTACRTGGTLSAEAKYVNKEEHTIYVFEKATKHKGKRKLKKKIPQDLWDILEPRIERGGKLFNITDSEVNGLLRACYKDVLPKDLAEDIPMPFHFLRHQFAQHALRKSNWNYGLVAKLGHWTVETLERYYGKMDEQTAFESGEEILQKL